MRRFVKSATEVLIGNRLAIRAARITRAGADVILAYHNVISTGAPSGDRSLHLPLARFVEQVEWLQSHFGIVPLDELLLDGGDRSRAAITFDDAYRGAVRLGLPELAARGIPATIFVCSGWEGGELPWWDALADPDSGLSPAVRRTALEEYAGRTACVMAWARGMGMRSLELSDEYRIAAPAEVNACATRGDFKIGMHSRTHPDLTRLSNDDLREEVEACRSEISRKSTAAIEWFAYPYGSTDVRVRSAVERAGYRAAVRIDGGGTSRRGSVDRFDLPRLNVPSGISTRGFRILVARA